MVFDCCSFVLEGLFCCSFFFVGGLGLRRFYLDIFFREVRMF